MKQRAHSVWWKNELPLLFYQDESSDGNQWKQEEIPYQRGKNADMKSVIEQRKNAFGRNLEL